MVTSFARRTGSQGQATIEGLAPGRYRVSVSKGAAASTSDVVEVFEPTREVGQCILQATGEHICPDADATLSVDQSTEPRALKLYTGSGGTVHCNTELACPPGTPMNALVFGSTPFVACTATESDFMLDTDLWAATTTEAVIPTVNTSNQGKRRDLFRIRFETANGI